jgi:hypothetical protein
MVTMKDAIRGNIPGAPQNEGAELQNKAEPVATRESMQPEKEAAVIPKTTITAPEPAGMKEENVAKKIVKKARKATKAAKKVSSRPRKTTVKKAFRKPRKMRKKALKTAGKIGPKTEKKAPGKGRGRGARYTESQKTSILSRYHDIRKAGESAVKAARKVGVSYLTLNKWEKQSGKRMSLRKGRKKKAGKPGRPRKERAATKSTIALGERGLVLVTPSGYRIEGISANDLIKVLKALQ